MKIHVKWIFLSGSSNNTMIWEEKKKYFSFILVCMFAKKKLTCLRFWTEKSEILGIGFFPFKNSFENKLPYWTCHYCTYLLCFLQLHALHDAGEKLLSAFSFLTDIHDTRLFCCNYSIILLFLVLPSWTITVSFT